MVDIDTVDQTRKDGRRMLWGNNNPNRGGATVMISMIIVLAGCGGPTVDNSACTTTSDELLTALTIGLDGPDALRFGRQVTADREDLSFVSAERYDPDDAGSKGEIYTWAVSVDSDDYLAVDTRAKEHSSWPPAAFDVREAGAIESRSCTDHARKRSRDGQCPAGTPADLCDRNK